MTLFKHFKPTIYQQQTISIQKYQLTSQIFYYNILQSPMKIIVQYEDVIKTYLNAKSYDNLIQFIQSSFSGLPERYQVAYKDSDDQDITIASDKDMQVMEETIQQQTIKVYVMRKSEGESEDEEDQEILTFTTQHNNYYLNQLQLPLDNTKAPLKCLQQIKQSNILEEERQKPKILLNKIKDVLVSQKNSNQPSQISNTQNTQKSSVEKIKQSFIMFKSKQQKQAVGKASQQKLLAGKDLIYLKNKQHDIDQNSVPQIKSTCSETTSKYPQEQSKESQNITHNSQVKKQILPKQEESQKIKSYIQQRSGNQQLKQQFKMDAYLFASEFDKRIQLYLPLIMENVSRLIDQKVNLKNKNQKQINAKKSQIVHYVRCTYCKTHKIQGIRYKCLVCLEFNLCDRCESTNEHHHNLLKMKYPEAEQKYDDKINLINKCFKIQQYFGQQAMDHKQFVSENKQKSVQELLQIQNKSSQNQSKNKMGSKLLQVTKKLGSYFQQESSKFNQLVKQNPFCEFETLVCMKKNREILQNKENEVYKKEKELQNTGKELQNSKKKLKNSLKSTEEKKRQIQDLNKKLGFKQLVIKHYGVNQWKQADKVGMISIFYDKLPKTKKHQMTIEKMKEQFDKKVKNDEKWIQVKNQQK